MLTLLPVLYLLFTALLVFFLRRLKRGTGYSWLVGIVLVLIGWGGVLALHWFDLPILSAVPWRPYDPQGADQIIFSWDDFSLDLAFALVSLLLCLLLTAPARLDHNSSPLTWAGNITITALGVFAVLAATPMATVLVWTLLDIVEIFILLRLLQEKQHSSQVVIAISARVAGTLVLLWAMTQSQAIGQPLSYPTMQQPFGVYLLFAAGLRLGVLPLNVPYASVLPLQRGLSNTLRMTSQVSSLVMLARMAGGSIPEVWVNILLPITVIGTFYGAAMWITAKDELDGRRYWSLAVSGLSVASILQGSQQAALVWGQVLIISGGIILFYSTRSRAMTVLPALGLLGLIGVPYTPAAGGMPGITADPFQFWDFLLILILGLLIAGYARLSLQPGEAPGNLERWAVGVYPIGLFLLAVSGWLIAILSPGGVRIGVWWAGMLALTLAVAVFWLLRALKQAMTVDQERWSRSAVIANRIGAIYNPIFRLGWFYSLLWSIFGIVQRILGVITHVLEGEGGMLWAILLVALLLTILAGGGFLG